MYVYQIETPDDGTIAVVSSVDKAWEVVCSTRYERHTSEALMRKQLREDFIAFVDVGSMNQFITVTGWEI